MESQLFNQWVQAQIPEASQQNAVGVVPQHEAARSDDWSKERMANITGTGMTDLNEFTTLADLPGELLPSASHVIDADEVHVAEYVCI